MDAPDPRVTPARPDLAAKHLEGKVSSAKFVAGRRQRVVPPQVPLRRVRANDAPLETEALKGEVFIAYDDDDEGWSWGQLADDGYVGWLPSSALGPAMHEPTHRVGALRSLAFPGPSIKLPPVETLPLGSLLAIRRTHADLAETAEGLYVPVKHLVSAAQFEQDFVSVAERFVGAPYLWGGKTNDGIDCSGLLQVALQACGQICPRDSDMQERDLGAAIPADFSNLRRGDLLFWPGHVAMACDSSRMIHANSFHMAVAIEPIRDAVRRIAATGTELRSVRRIGGLPQN